MVGKVGTRLVVVVDVVVVVVVVGVVVGSSLWEELVVWWIGELYHTDRSSSAEIRAMQAIYKGEGWSLGWGLRRYGGEFRSGYWWLWRRM